MANSSIDLHLHSHYSDGHASPAEIIRYAAAIGLKTISITDHDHFRGWQESRLTASQFGLELIPGVEFTARWDGCSSQARTPSPGQNIDILSYFFNPQDTNLINFCGDLLDDLKLRITNCCKMLSEAGYSIGIDDVVNENPYYPGSSQLISALYHKGLTADWDQAFELFANFWPQVRTTDFTVRQVIQAAHKAGGIAILAHPVIVRCFGDELLTDDALQLFIDAGLDGLEVNHPMQDSRARRHFLNLAEKHHLLISGGSDEHGPDGGFSRMGSELVTAPMLAAMQVRAQKYSISRSSYT